MISVSHSHGGASRTSPAEGLGYDKTNCNPCFGADAKGPSDRMPEELQAKQVPMDLIDEACMESFPCSDPPSYTRCHA